MYSYGSHHIPLVHLSTTQMILLRCVVNFGQVFCSYLLNHRLMFEYDELPKRCPCDTYISLDSYSNEVNGWLCCISSKHLSNVNLSIIETFLHFAQHHSGTSRVSCDWADNHKYFLINFTTTSTIEKTSRLGT